MHPGAGGSDATPLGVTAPFLPGSASLTSARALLPGEYAFGGPVGAPLPPLVAGKRAALESRITAWETLFPRALLRLRSHYGFASRSPLPLDCAEPYLDCLGRAFSVEDALVAAYRAALQSDRCFPLAYPGAPVADVLDGLAAPDALLCACLEHGALGSALLGGVVGSDFHLSLRYGLLPFGSWSVFGILGRHVAFPPPEYVELLGAVGATAPPIWGGPRSLTDLVTSASRCLRELRALQAPVDLQVTLCIPQVYFLGLLSLFQLQPLGIDAKVGA